MNTRLIAAFLIFLMTGLIGGSSYADSDDDFSLGISVSILVRDFPDIFADPRKGLKFASCYSLDPDAGGPVEAFLVFLPPDPSTQIDAEFFWIGANSDGRFLQDFASVFLLRDDIEVGPIQGGMGIEEEMERTIVPLFSMHPRAVHSAEEIFQRPRRRCRYSPHWNYENPQPRHRPKVAPEWLAAK